MIKDIYLEMGNYTMDKDHAPRTFRTSGPGPLHIGEVIPDSFAKLFGTVPAINSLTKAVVTTKEESTLLFALKRVRDVRERIFEDDIVMRDACAGLLSAVVRHMLSTPKMVEEAFDIGLDGRGSDATNGEAALALSIKGNWKASERVREGVNSYILLSSNLGLKERAARLRQTEFSGILPSRREIGALRR